jgi:hypothetical protein
MYDLVSFDIMLLGLTNPGEAARARYANAMSRLTGRSQREFGNPSPSFEVPIFSSLDQGVAQLVARTLGDAGALIEIRRSSTIARDSRGQLAPVDTCPTCGFVQPAGGAECSKCGLVFSKFEREQIQHMQQDRGLEESLTKAIKSREEWYQRASQYLETHPLQQESIASFANQVEQGELPFLKLVADEGELLLTSRRVLATHKDGSLSIPYEMIEDVNFGGGLVAKKSRTRLQLVFQAPMAIGDGSTKSLAWQLDKESSFSKEVVMDWAFARNFMCGACGARDLEFRFDNGKNRCRCMHCATDHHVDLREALAIPASVH